VDDFLEAVRLTEALLFAAEEPVTEVEIEKRLPGSVKATYKTYLERKQSNRAKPGRFGNG